ncbi:MAG TPA: CNNM domain-containing protein [Phycisphaerae bacterium]|nr:CNNM domain-containing protein [Phycisphaerae bacterium]
MIALWIILAVACVAASGFYSGSETGAYCINRIRLRLRADTGDRRAVTLRRLLADEQGLLVSVLIGTNLSNYLTTVCVAYIFTTHYYAEGRAELYTTLIVAPVIFVFGEVLPKNLYQRHADRLVRGSTWPLVGSYFVCRALGLIGVLKRISRIVIRAFSPLEADRTELVHPRQEVVALLREGLGHGVLSEQQSLSVERVMRLQHVRVGHVMIPRSRTAVVQLDASRERMLEQIGQHEFSRLPVCTSDPRRIVGILNIYDVLQADPQATVEQLMRPPLRVRLEESVMGCLVRMQRARQPMAVVEIGDGRAVGIVTIKDLVEEIVGELAAW